MPRVKGLGRGVGKWGRTHSFRAPAYLLFRGRLSKLYSLTWEQILLPAVVAAVHHAGTTPRALRPLKLGVLLVVAAFDVLREVPGHAVALGS